MTAIETIDTVVIGAGQAGLAASRCLTDRGVDHVVLERGRVAERWRTERWDSLRLLTPNWMTRLPGWSYRGSDPHGFMTAAEVTTFFADYAAAAAAPVVENRAVVSVDQADGGFAVTTTSERWQARKVVIATGWCDRPAVPAATLDPAITNVSPSSYRNPASLPDGGVLVVGASASGTQIANEIHRSGRSVTLAVGEHIRAPRMYRGRDLQWWMDAAGVHDEGYDAVDDIARARRVPSLQLAGTPDRSTLDLNALTDIGVRLVGRLAGITEGGKAQFAGSLRNMCALSDLKMGRLLDLIDAWACDNGIDGEVAPPHRLPPTRVEASPPLGIDLKAEIRTIIWATGYHPDYSWLDVPVLDRKGQIQHDGGVTEEPGLYVMGLQFLRRRKSALIDGAGDDARDLSDHIASYLTESAPVFAKAS